MPQEFSHRCQTHPKSPKKMDTTREGIMVSLKEGGAAKTCEVHWGSHAHVISWAIGKRMQRKEGLNGMDCYLLFPVVSVQLLMVSEHRWLTLLHLSLDSRSRHKVICSLLPWSPQLMDYNHWPYSVCIWRHQYSSTRCVISPGQSRTRHHCQVDCYSAFYLPYEQGTELVAQTAHFEKQLAVQMCHFE